MNQECIKMRELMFDAAKNTLSENEKEQLLLHIEACEECRKEYSEICELSMELKELSQDAPPCLLENVMASVKAYEKKKYIRQKRSMQARFASVAAAFLIIVISTVFLLPKPEYQTGTNNLYGMYINGNKENYDGVNGIISGEKAEQEGQTGSTDFSEDALPPSCEDIQNGTGTWVSDGVGTGSTVGGEAADLLTVTVYRAKSELYEKYRSESIIVYENAKLGYVLIENSSKASAFVLENASYAGESYNSEITESAKNIIASSSSLSKNAYIVVIFE